MNTEFLSYLRGMGKSPKTVAGYCRDVEQYLCWCEETFAECPSQLYRANVLEYISYMRNIKGYNPKTVNHHLSSLRSYNDWLIESGQQSDTVILKNDFMKIQLQYASPSTVTKKDVEAFRQRLLESDSKRDYAIVTLFAYSGIRRSECADLKLDQVDLTAKEIRVIGKGDKQRLVYINDKIVYALREYLKERNSDSPYFFVSRQSEKLTTSRINQIFNKYSNNITPKTLRHPYVKPKTTNSNKFFTDFPHQRQNRLLSRLFQHSAPDRRTPSQSEHPPAQNSDYPYPPPFAPTLCWLFSFFRLSAAGLV